MTVQTYMTEAEAREWARHYGGNPSWYWDAQRRSHVLISDGVTTPGDLGVEIVAGRGDPAAVADYFVMAAQLLDAQATFAVGEARQRDIDEETFDSQADLAAAEAHDVATQAQLADLQRAADDLHHTAEVERIATDQAHDDRTAARVERHAEVRRVYNLLFDKEHDARFCEGDGPAEDNYSDDIWEAAENLVDNGRTAQSITAGRAAAASAYPEPAPDEGEGDNELWARLTAAPQEVHDEFGLVHPRAVDPDISEAMLAGAYAAVGLAPAAVPANELVGTELSDQEYEAELQAADERAMWAALAEAELLRQSQHPEDVATDDGTASGDLTEAEFLRQSRNPEDAHDDDGTDNEVVGEGGSAVCPAFESDPQVRALVGALDGEDLDCTQAVGHDDGGRHLSSSGLAWVDPTAYRPLVSTGEPDMRGYSDAAEDAFFAGEPAVAGYSAAAVADPDEGSRAYAEMLLEEARLEVGEVEGSDGLLAEMAAGRARQRAEHETFLLSLSHQWTNRPAPATAASDALQAEQAAHGAVGKSADEVLAGLIAELDATTPDAYPGDEQYQAQLRRYEDRAREQGAIWGRAGMTEAEFGIEFSGDEATGMTAAQLRGDAADPPAVKAAASRSGDEAASGGVGRPAPMSAAEVSERGLWGSVAAVYPEPYGGGDLPIGYRELLKWAATRGEWVEPGAAVTPSAGPGGEEPSRETAPELTGDLTAAETPADGAESPGKPPCAEAVAAAREAVAAAARRVADQQQAPARSDIDDRSRADVAQDGDAECDGRGGGC